MDINQIAKMIEWLDEERRHDKQTIATLEERLAQQEETISGFQRRINTVESDQTVMKETSNTLTADGDLMEQLRSEMRQLLEGSEARRLTAEREAERRQELNREGLSRTIRDLQEQVEKIQRNIGSVTEIKSDTSRMIETIAVVQQNLDTLTKRMDENDRRFASLEEQRRQDARRINELESEIPEVKKQIDTMRPKMNLIEDLSLRNERRMQDVQNGDRERREQMQQFIDQQQLMMQQNEQKVEDVLKRFGQHDKDMQENIERFETWAGAYRDMKRLIDDFDRIGERLERRINEVGEMQRLSEERFRVEWNDWGDDDQKRWKQMRLSSDEVWRNHDKEFMQYTSRLENIESVFEPLADSLRRLWSLERERANLYRDSYQALLRQYDTDATSTQSVSAISDGINGNIMNPSDDSSRNG
jgi:chromosome segregation ATPase